MAKEDRLIYLVFMAQQKLRTYLHSTLRAEGVRVTPVQAGILFLLELQNGRAMTELSQHLGADNSTLTGLVDRLEKAGLVERRPSPNDRRVLLIDITPDGIQEAEKAKSIIRRVNEEIKAGFDEEEISSFKRVLNSFLDKFNRSEKPARDVPKTGGLR